MRQSKGHSECTRRELFAISGHAPARDFFSSAHKGVRYRARAPCTRLFHEHRNNDFITTRSFAPGTGGLDLEPIYLDSTSLAVDQPINLSSSVPTSEEYIL